MIKKRSLEGYLKSIKPIEKIKKIARKGDKQVYIVGGMLRDILLGYEIKDLDIAVSGKGENLAGALGKYFSLKKGFDEYRVKMKELDIDILGLGETEILKDLERRDFTINAMAYNLLDKRFIDPYNGIKDLENKTIKAISRKNILDDVIRILRGLRFKASLGFSIEKKTEMLFKEYSTKLKECSPERIHQELMSIFNLPQSHNVILPEVFNNIFPGFSEMKEITGGKITGNLLEHSIKTLESINEIISDPSMLENFERKINEYTGRKAPGLRLVALLHDIKKPQTMEKKGNEVHFYGHDKMAAEWFQDIGEKLKFSSSDRDFISKLIKNHMWIHLLAHQSEITERAKRRMAFRMGEDVIGLVLFTLADQKASTGIINEELFKICKNIIDYYFESKKEVEEPILRGRDLIEEFSLTPGPLFGRILSRVQNAYEEGEIRTREDALDFVREEFIKDLDIESEENNIDKKEEM